ncbi:MAG: 6-hydroxymethylpterin diphosphokinase MptE-like protein [Clostridia bacterium]
MNEEQFRGVIDFFNDKHLAQDPKKVWNKNTLQNLPRCSKEKSIWKLRDKHLEDAIIIVGASPCLTEDVKELAKLERNPHRKNFVVIVVNSALKPCLKAGVKPDYVIAIDGNPETIVEDLKCDNKNLTLIASNNVAPEIFKVWKGKNIWWSPYYCLSKEVLKKISPILGKRMPSGGNTFSAAMGIGYTVFGSRIFIMVGSEHCYDEQYYAHKKSRWEKTDDLSHWKVLDIKGRERWTNIPLWQYKIWIEHMANDLPHCHFIDTSFGLLGTDTKRIQHISLKEAITKTTEAFNVVSHQHNDSVNVEKERYDKAYATGKYTPEAGIGLFKKLFKKVTFGNAKTFLDVGTGFGQVVAYLRNKGYESYGCDFSDGTRRFWEMGNITQFCTVCPAHKMPYLDDEFDVVSCTEMFEHIPEDKVLDTLKEIYRVGRGDFIFSYALMRAFHKMPHDGSEPHITLKTSDWWIRKVQEAGFNIIAVILSKEQQGGVIYATKGKRDAKGKMPTRTMFIQSKEGMHLGGNFANMACGTGLPKSGNNSLC